MEVLGTQDIQKAKSVMDALQGKNIQAVMEVLGTQDIQKAQALIDKLKGGGVRNTAAKMVDARKAAEEADKDREKKQQGGPSAGVSQLGSVAKATNVLMGRAANDGILEESRRQTSLLRTIKENTKPKTTNPPEVPIPVFA